MSGRRVQRTLQPAVLGWARERAGLATETIAAKVGVSPDRVLEWEWSRFESSFGLELLSTVHWVIMRESPGDIDDTISRVYGRNDRKKQFSVRQIELAADILITKGWDHPGVLEPSS